MKKNVFTKLFVTTLSMFFSVLLLSFNSEAASQSAKNAVSQILYEAIQTHDGSLHDIYSYRMTEAEVQAVYRNLRDDVSTNLLIESYNYNLYLYVRKSGNYAKSVQFYYMSDDALSLYPKMVSRYETIASGIDDSMSDLDKLIYFHDTIVESTVYYKYGDNRIYGSNGVFLDGKAVCMGYADALILLLNSEGIDAYYTKEKVTLNHGWVYVNIDGNWYHIDPTWDDTRSGVSGVTGHSFLLRNDDEFAAPGKNTHGDYTWKFTNSNGDIIDGPGKSTSTAFTNWYVHDIVGKMLYYNGYWYYVDSASNSIKRATAYGEDMQTVFDGKGLSTIKILSISKDTLYYSFGGATQTLDLKETADDDNETIIEQPVVDQTAPVVSVTAPAPTPVSSTVGVPASGNIKNQVFWNDFSLWKSGIYNWYDGKYMSSSNRICLSDYIEVLDADIYTAKISNNSYSLIIRELDENKKFIKTVLLNDGETYTPSNNSAYLGISLYAPSFDSSTSYATFKVLFNEGFTVGLVGTKVVESSTTEEIGADNCYSWNDFDLWKSGNYNWYNGNYMASNTRICLNDYIEINNDTYTTVLSNDSFRILIRELDCNKKFIKTVVLANNDLYTPSDNCEYLGISLYSPTLESSCSFDSFKSLFAAGIQIGLNGSKTGDNYEETGNEETNADTDTASVAENIMTASEVYNTAIVSENEETIENSISPVNEVIVPEDNNITENASTETTEAENTEVIPEIIEAPEETFAVYWNDFSSWRTGLYNWYSGAYMNYASRICLNDYYAFSGVCTFTVDLSDSSYHLLVRELDANKGFIASHDLASGESFTTNSGCAFLAISLYSPENESTTTFETYADLFTNGFTVGIK